MNVKVNPRNLSIVVSSTLLEDMSNYLETEYDFVVAPIESPPSDGVKDSLTIGLTILGLGISTLSMLISALQYWQSQKERYSLSISSGDISISVENITKERLQEIATYIQSLSTSQTAELEIVIEPYALIPDKSPE